jgi:hypothetical protein
MGSKVLFFGAGGALCIQLGEILRWKILEVAFVSEDGAGISTNREVVKFHACNP